MPTDLVESQSNYTRRRTAAIAAVKAKYPNIIEGSSGWHRALNNRIRRTK